MNCLHPVEGNPCGKCEICTSFKEGKLLDIIEIDAASNTWVDNVRELIEKAQFTPNRTKYKIYIIDEVHMLSKWAFNALLKILEEPPSHVKFILATTEIHKVLDTILSRCQRYDFRSIQNSDIQDRLSFIAKEEHISIDGPSLEYISENASGGLRNAINLFEQLIHDGKIDFDYLVEHLWVTSKNSLKAFYEKLLHHDTSIIGDYEALVSSGKSLKLFFKDLIFYIKNDIISLLKSGNPLENSLHILELLDETYGKTKYSLDENITFLTGILKIISQSKNVKPLVSQPPIPIVKKSEKPPEEPKQVVSPQDIQDVFSVAQKSDVTASWDSWTFDKDTFIWSFKDAGASPSAIMSLKESEFTLDNEVLMIQPKNKFSKMGLEKGENIALLNQTLSSIWLENYSVHIS